MYPGEIPPHVQDPARLAALRRVALLDTPVEESFDRLTRLATTILEAPIALVTLIDADRVFFKSFMGIPEPWASRREEPLSHSYCLYNRIAGEPLLVEDARIHPQFKDSPAIREMQAISYLGFPLITADGYILGSFCVIDTRPRRWEPKEINIIRDLAAAVMTEIHLRAEISARNRAEGQRDDLAGRTDELERRVEERTRELQEKQLQYLHVEKLAAIGSLAASISHEFNNPLQSIITILKGFKSRLELGEEDKALMDLAISENLRMKNLIRSLHDFNRPSSGKRVLMDVNASLDSLLLLCKSDLKRKEISTTVSYAERLPLITAVPDQIKQVFLNLLTNAMDACIRNGREITIRTWRENQRVAVAIEDTGIGIAADKLELIFQPFYTSKPTTKGTGLGLSVCNGIVQSHRGEIRVESQLGIGSIFTVLLPISAE